MKRLLKLTLGVALLVLVSALAVTLTAKATKRVH